MRQAIKVRWTWLAATCLLAFLASASPSAQPQSTKPQAAKPGTAQLSPRVTQALALEQQAKYPQALEAWQAVVKAEPRNAMAFAHLGLIEARLENYPEAIAAYRKSKALNPAIPELDFNLGLAQFKSGQFTEAAKSFEFAERKKPSPAETKRLQILIGMSHYGAREYGAAIPYLKEAAAADPKNLPLRLNLAHCYLWTKQLDATLGVYKEILEIDPDSAEADMIAGEALDEKGDNAGAVQQFRAATLANPKEPNVHFGLAYLLWAQKRYDEAIPEFKAELENDPRNDQAMLYLGDTLVQQNRFDEARDTLLRAEQHQAKVPLVHLDLGLVAMETGDPGTAESELKQTVALEPDNVAAHFRLAKLYQASGKRDEAKVEFAKASSLNKKTDEGLYRKIAEANARPAPGTTQQSTPDKPSAEPPAPSPNR
jgi:tetratricopeptide (TPR) repeat protein